MIDRKKLLQIKEVVQEIDRHKWIQSEMVGYDVGFDKAADDWFAKYAASWLEFHPDLIPSKQAKTKSNPKRKSSSKMSLLFW